MQGVTMIDAIKEKVKDLLESGEIKGFLGLACRTAMSLRTCIRRVMILMT